MAQAGTFHILPQSFFEPGEAGWRVCQADGDGDFFVPGWFEETYPDLTGVYATPAAAQDDFDAFYGVRPPVHTPSAA